MSHTSCGICGSKSGDRVIRRDDSYTCEKSIYCCKGIILQEKEKIKCMCTRHDREIVEMKNVKGDTILVLQPLCKRCRLLEYGLCRNEGCRNQRHWIPPSKKDQHRGLFHRDKLLEFCSPQCPLLIKSIRRNPWEKSSIIIIDAIKKN